ncbi:MAG: SDR family NAD(P)-dependent oxidoreductase [Solirubrobacteraceae bacterium]
MDLGLQGRPCAVTGASSGIGRATALSLVREGASVLLVGRREGPLAEVAAECRRRGGLAQTLALDVTAADVGERVVEALLGHFDRIDVLVNNAGTSSIRTLDQLTDEDWQTQWELNVIGPMRLMRAAAPEMANRGWGRIVNVSSSSGKRPSSTNMAYSVAKAAELSLSRAFADLYAANGVLINAVAPGAVATDLWMAPGGMADQAAEAQAKTREEVLAATAGRSPLGRFSTEEEIAAVITFLCSEAASNVAGAAWSADGGTVPVII